MSSRLNSTAVMQLRLDPRDSLDDFPTPPWATRAACEYLIGHGLDLSAATVREPCANRGFMVRPLREYFATVDASDIHDYGAGFAVADYLSDDPCDRATPDWTFLNPPFTRIEAFIGRALASSRTGVALIARTAILEGIGRYAGLYTPRPPWSVCVHVERVPMVKGRCDPKASSATSYSWLFWRKDTAARLPLDWIPPCRKRLERGDDYQFQINGGEK